MHLPANFTFRLLVASVSKVTWL